MIGGNLSALVHQQRCETVSSASLPATPDGDVCASCPRPVAHAGLSSARPNDSPALLEPSLAPPFPLPAPSPLDIPTPLQNRQPDATFSFAGTVLPPPPTPPAAKTSHNLRLPSFDLLGIAAPHPDRIPLPSHHSFSLGAGPLSKPEDPLHVLSPPLGRNSQLDGADHLPESNPEPAEARVDLIVPVVTPPAESGTFNWGTVVNVRAAAQGSPPSSGPAQSHSGATIDGAGAPPPGSAPIVVPTLEGSRVLGMAAWAQRVEETLIAESNLQAISSVKILSHALPCPSTTGHLFGHLIAAIHDLTPTNTAWINVFHAVPGRFTLSDLPKSPPSTPGPAVGGDEYFTTKVFDSAVAIPDYQLDSKLLSPSPRPVVPPGSVHISIVERYIPPTNTNEYAEMFELRGRSLLHDRLVELSPDSGLLLFIYPTKTGARTFMQDYLGPILDPLLRSMTVVHDLSSELGKNLGQMTSVAYLDEYESLRKQVDRYCRQLSESGTGGMKSVYTLVRASKEATVPERSTWADDWWIKQEKPRIRETVNAYFRQVKKLPESEMTGSHLIQEVLDGVSNRKSEDDRPRRGIEVGVFIIKKSNSH